MLVYAVKLDKPIPASSAAELELLLPEERRMRSGSRISDSVLSSYALLRLALQRCYGLHELPEISLGRAGKPYFPELGHIHFSLSHTDCAAVCALSTAPVGVDIERIRPMSPRKFGRFFSKSELDCCGPDRLIQLWTLKESYVKFLGDGLSAMNSAEIMLLPDGSVAMAGGPELIQFENISGCACSVCTETSDAPELNMIRLEKMLELCSDILYNLKIATVLSAV